MSELKQLRLEMRKRRHIPVSDHWQLAQRYAYYGLTGNHRPMKRFCREVEAIWRRTLHRRSQKAGMFMPRILRLLRRFPLGEPTILNPYRTVIQELIN